jgi:hypothetical protein
MTQHFRNLHIKFTTNLNRTKQFQLENLRARDTLDFIEIQEFVMDRIYIDIKEKVTDATTVYYRSLIDQYKILYSAFIVLMTGLFTAYMVLGYQKIKRSMWKTNLILKILPLEVIPKLCLPDLKAFFKY